MTKFNYLRLVELHCEMNGTLNAPPGLSYRQKTKMKFIDDSKCGQNLFRTELESFLAFLPLKFWVFHLNECNKYVDQFFMTNGNGNKKFAGSNWKSITIIVLKFFMMIFMFFNQDRNTLNKYFHSNVASQLKQHEECDS